LNKIKKRKNGLIVSNKYWVPDEGFLLAENKEYYNKLKYINNITELNLYKRFLRPVLLSLKNCKNILIKGVIFQNSPVWNIHVLMSENIIIDRIFVKNPVYAYYGDGIDIDSSKNALIVNSIIDVGDDGICIKSGKYGKKENLLSENIIVDGCTFFSGHAGFAIGSEISGGAKNIKVSNCQFLGTENGLKFKSDKGKGALVEKIYIENISMKDIVNYVIIFDMNYNTKNISKEFINENNKTLENKNDENIPCFRNISIKDLYCNGAKQAMKFNGLSEFPINDILFKNIYIIANNVSEFNETKNIIQENVNITIN
jgi:polygalacturonase